METLIGSIRQGIPCLFHLITGLYCPGCGGTRAVKFLLRGEVVKSFQYHPLVLYVFVVAAAELISFGLARILKKPGLFVGHLDWFTYGGVFITVLNWVYKNYMLLAKGVDLLA